MITNSVIWMSVYSKGNHTALQEMVKVTANTHTHTKRQEMTQKINAYSQSRAVGLRGRQEERSAGW